MGVEEVGEGKKRSGGGPKKVTMRKARMGTEAAAKMIQSRIKGM